MINLDKIESCYERINKYIGKTRLEKSLYLSDNDTKVYLKLECEQPVVRNFKIRGVLGKLTLLNEDDLKKGVATISSGNQGVSLSYACHLMGIANPIIVAPHTSPQPKIDKMKHFNADINLLGETFDEATQLGEEFLSEKDCIMIDAREDEDGFVGAGTIGLEIYNDLPDIDAIIVPMGSGGNAIANSSYLKQKNPNIKVYGVQPECSPALLSNLKNNKWTKYFPIDCDSIMQSLVGGVAKYTFDNCKNSIDNILLVSEEDVKTAVYEIALNEKVICEPDSASTYAAFKKYRHLFEGKKTALIITGGNISNQVFKDIISCRELVSV